MKFIKNYNLFIVLIFIITLDRISKYIIINKVNSSGENKVFNSEFLNFELIWNKGIAFGLLSFSSHTIYNLISLIIFLVILVIIFLLFKSKKIEKLFFTLILGGAIGNLYDRMIYKSVPDFIDFHINNFHWFIFNVADIFITLGILFMVTIELFNKENK